MFCFGFALYGCVWLFFECLCFGYVLLLCRFVFGCCMRLNGGHMRVYDFVYELCTVVYGFV